MSRAPGRRRDAELSFVDGEEGGVAGWPEALCLFVGKTANRQDHLCRVHAMVEGVRAFDKLDWKDDVAFCSLTEDMEEAVGPGDEVFVCSNQDGMTGSVSGMAPWLLQKKNQGQITGARPHRTTAGGKAATPVAEPTSS